MIYYSLINIECVEYSDVEAVKRIIENHYSDLSALKRKESVLAKFLLDYLLKEEYGVTDYQIKCKENGKPYIVNSGIHFNLSHSDNCVLCACADENVGCDIQHTAIYKPRISERFFTPEEHLSLMNSSDKDKAFTRLWTLKESALKLSGDGISGGLDKWDFSEHFDSDEFDLNGLSFICRDYGDFVTSICSQSGKTEEKKVDITDIIKNERGLL